MSHVLVAARDHAAALAASLEAAPRLALDCEAAGFHRYSDRLCLVQLTVGGQTYVVDPLAFDPSGLLRGPLERPDVAVLMHGSDFDLRLLRRDLGIRVAGLFDTQIAASLLGEEALGLAALLESRLGVRLSKKHQRADWAERPLNDEMLEYAADDTRYLPQLADRLADEVARAGRTAWVEEECRALEAAADAPDEPAEPEDPVVRVKGARRLSPRQATALRAALEWRDEVARARDRALFRVVGDAPLVEAVATRPRSVEDLERVKGFPRGLARSEGRDLLKRLDAVAAMDDSALRPYPSVANRGPGRPPPELEELVDALKVARNGRAEALGLPRGTLLANGVLLDIARARPRDREELEAVEGMRRWRTEVVGDDLLAVLRRAK
jgi:ribonuclease D